MLRLRSQRVPSPTEGRMFTLFAHKASTLGMALLEGKRLVTSVGALGPTDPTRIEPAPFDVNNVVAEHVRRGEDLLTLIARLMGLVGASTGKPKAGMVADPALHVLLAIAMAELLQREATSRFAGYAPLRDLAQAALTPLVSGFVARFGPSLPPEAERVFPRFAEALSDVCRPVSSPGWFSIASRLGEAVAAFADRAPPGTAVSSSRR